MVTQFAVPSLPFGMVERPRLSERLRNGLQGPVTLVCAPAGQRQDGARGRGCPALPAPRRVGHARADRRRARPSVGRGADRARVWPARCRRTRRSPRSRRRCASRATSFMPLLVNALASSRAPVPLVLDDVHLLRSRECLAQLVVPAAAHAGPAAARADRPLGPGAAAARPARARPARGDPRRRSRVHGGGDRRAARRARAASSRTISSARCTPAPRAGAPGLRLAALSLQGREDPERFVAEFAGDDRVVGDYLLAEVLDRQPPRLRAFLLRTSLVDRICGSLADALTGDRHGADTLADARAHERVRDRRRRPPRVVPLPPPVREAPAHAGRARARRRAAAACTSAPRAGTPSSGAAVDALAARRRRRALGPRGRDRRRALVRPLRPRRRRRRPLAARARSRAITCETDAELAAALACAALDVGRHRRGGGPSRARRARRRRACRNRAAAATWRRWRSPASRRRGCEGDFDGALDGRRRAAGRGGRARRRLRRRAPGARARDARRDRAVGPPARPRRARSSRAPSRSRGCTASTTSRCRRSATSRCST